MDPAGCIVRRANLDDLEGLKQLWERTGMQVMDMERRLTEFQLVSSLDGDLKGVVALHVEGRQALLYGEAFVRPEEEDAYRPMLWERIKTLAKNHGVARVWTREEAPFWHQVAGFADAAAEVLQRLPVKFGDPHHRWLTAALRDDAVEAPSWEKEFEMFHQASRAGMEQEMAKARRLRAVVLTIALAIFFAGVVVGFVTLVGLLKKSGR
jgi:N-acetylglutamate synthase-like GNAT family acetyltransferase